MLFIVSRNTQTLSTDLDGDLALHLVHVTNDGSNKRRLASSHLTHHSHQMSCWDVQVDAGKETTQSFVLLLVTSSHDQG